MKNILFDQYRYTGQYSCSINLKLLFTDRSFRRIFYYRNIRESHGIKKYIFRVLNHLLSRKTSIEIPSTVEIGRGLLLIHPYCITFNSRCVIGDNFTILKGATIGNSKTGKIGAPKIGNNVYVGLNSTVVGNINIGDNVLIAANTFVNFDVPSDCIVIGSPGVIHKKESASIPYINNSICNI